MRGKLWIHLCEGTRELTWVGRGEQCNWCDVQELSCEELQDGDMLDADLSVPQERSVRRQSESPKQ